MEQSRFQVHFNFPRRLVERGIQPRVECDGCGNDLEWDGLDILCQHCEYRAEFMMFVPMGDRVGFIFS